MKKLYAITALILLGVVTGNVAHAESTLTDDVKMGAHGEKITMLQDFLRAEGHFSVASTGYFGPVTLAALKSYQTANGLPATGTLDLATVAIIQTENESGEAVVDAAMARHPEEVPAILAGVKGVLADLDPTDKDSRSMIAQLSWLLHALVGGNK